MCRYQLQEYLSEYLARYLFTVLEWSSGGQHLKEVKQLKQRLQDIQEDAKLEGNLTTEMG